MNGYIFSDAPGYANAWRNGIAAHTRGQSKASNPYRNCADPKLAVAFERGWNRAREVRQRSCPAV